MRMHTPVVERPTVSLVLCHPHMSPGRAVFIIMPTFLLRKLGSDIVQIYNVQRHPNCAWGKPGLGAQPAAPQTLSCALGVATIQLGDADFPASSQN